MNNDFLADIQSIRARARQSLDGAAVTPNDQADRNAVLAMLDAALATELVCVLRYKRHYYMASGLCSRPVQAEFLQHASEEQAHADRIAERIVQLGGSPNLSPAELVDRSHSEYGEGATLLEMIRQDLIAERVAIESYGQMIRSLGPRDPTTRGLLERILAVEEEHAQDLASLLATLDPTKPGKPAVDPSVEDDYWRSHFATRPYVKPGERYESFQPAYRSGWEARGRYGELNWETAEPQLRRDWQAGGAASPISWEVARQAARDAWDRLRPDTDYSSDNR